jgi:alkanesulfonate monooxygenase SsuD/methylene tetrahydromethanopterin reductase-like flavin-dependent oxidoreductase (luciferase family)
MACCSTSGHDYHVKFGLFVPPFFELSNPHLVAELAARAEAAGWDGFFLWDHMLAGDGTPVADRSC